MATPSVKAASSGYSSIKISWNKVSGANGYYVYVKSGTTWKRISTITKGNTLSYQHTKLVCGKTYTYTVVAYRKVGKSIVRSAYNKTGVKGMPALSIPKVVKATASKNSVALKWNKVAGASGYYIYYKTGNSNYKRIKTIANGATISWNSKGLAKNKNYTYAIVAYRKEKGSIVRSGYKAFTIKTKAK